MKKILYVLPIFIFMLCITACSNNSQNEETNNSQNEEINNPIIDKIYMHSTPLEKTFDFEFIKFYSDNTFQGIHASFYKNPITDKNEPKYTNYYGTYEINGAALTMNISNDSFAGAIIDDGNTISFGNDQFINDTEIIDNDDPLLSEFK